MYIHRYGDGPRYYLGIHGWAADHTTFALLAEHMPKDCSIFAVDLPGYGKSHALPQWDWPSLNDAFTTALDWSWSYNNRGELVQADDQSTAGNDRAYEFDGIGNRKKTANGLLSDLPTSDNWAANSLNQYSTVANYTPAPVHDDGNLTTGPLPAAPSTASSLAWDGENRLISATVGATTITYTYDHLSRLTSATTGSTTVRYLYDGEPVAEPVDPEPAVGIEHHLDDGRVSEPSRHMPPERRPEHAGTAIDRF